MKYGVNLKAEQLCAADGKLFLRMSYPDDVNDDACTWYRVTGEGFEWLSCDESFELEVDYRELTA